MYVRNMNLSYSEYRKSQPAMKKRRDGFFIPEITETGGKDEVCIYFYGAV